MPRDICILLGKRIRELRKRRGWRQIDLAEHAGVNENYISDLETGKKEICVRMLQKIAVGLDVSIAKLMDGL
jgi:transcriptional regulator with XRE-family HTH domain